VDTAQTLPDALIPGLLLASSLAYVSYRRRWTDGSGSLVAAGVGALTFMGGVVPTVALLAFFFSSALLARWTRSKSADSPLVSEQSAARDAYQVMAVGALPALLSLARVESGQPRWLLASFAALAFACADTWATDVGQTYPARPRLLGFGAQVPTGFSGGMTLRGTSAALGGAGFLGLVGWLGLYSTWRSWALVTMVGFGASLLDSLLGATVQSRNICGGCGRLTERGSHCGRPATRLRRGLSNWGVNLVCSGVAAWLGYLVT
jgi:uncharacterized protein (TIGR00297 family)